MTKNIAHKHNPESDYIFKQTKQISNISLKDRDAEIITFVKQNLWSQQDGLLTS